MKITFIKPNISSSGESVAYSPMGRMQPLAFGILAGMTPSDIEVKFIDERLEPINFDEATSLVAISIDTFSAKRAYQISAEFSKRNIPVVLGGYHASLLPDEVAQHAHSVVVGEAEGVWLELLKDLKNKNLKKFYRSAERPNLSGLKVRRDIFRYKKYLPLNLVQFSRGCYNSCEFCATTQIFNRSLTHRPIEEVIAEIEGLDSKMIFWVDDNLIGNVTATKKLLRELVHLKVNWTGELSINFVEDEELFKLIVESGCRSLFIGFESLNKENLKQMGKLWNIKRGGYEEALKKIYEAGIKVYASFVFGYDADDCDVFERTADFAIKHKFYLTNFSILMPYPNTPLYERLKKQGRLLYEHWWLDKNYNFGQAVFRPKLLSPEELVAGCWKARMKFNCFSSIFKRGLDFKTNSKDPFNAMIFFTSNLMCRREIMRKQPILSWW